MKIWMISPQYETGKRIGSMLCHAGVTEIRYAKVLPQQTDVLPEDLLILYQKQEITGLLCRSAELHRSTGCRIILLLDPDKYAFFLDQARLADIELLLMPVSYQTLLDAVSVQ